MIAGDVNQSSIILYTWGYRGHKLSEIMPLMEQGATLVDIRFHPYSPAPQWRLWAFKKQFGDQYIWLGMLGNLAYRQRGDPFLIADFKAGFNEIMKLSQPIILMCACPDRQDCHRSLVAEMIVRRTGWQVEHL